MEIIKNNKYFLDEIKLLSNTQVLNYYTEIINNIDLKSNNQNSYIMWLVNKTNDIKLDKPSNIIPGKSSLPDIDTDFEVDKREDVIKYIKEKYGSDYVAQMATFGRMQGRGALKEVLRAHDRCSFEEMNRITEFIPDEAAIADDLQDMLEETGEQSIIQWALENNGDKLKEWCWLKEDGTLDGPLSNDFAQAIRLEGTKKSQGRHASGIIISGYKLNNIVPMCYDKSLEEQIIGIDMRDAEEMGLMKFDILGTAILDKISDAQNLIRTGVM